MMFAWLFRPMLSAFDMLALCFALSLRFPWWGTIIALVFFLFISLSLERACGWKCTR